MAAILAIETSCDETSVAILESEKNLLANVVNSQINEHQIYGGVVPEIASRRHCENILSVVHDAIYSAQINKNEIAAIAVTIGPGLIGALLVGLLAGKSLAWAWGKPLIAVNHVEAHINAVKLSYPDIEPPFVALVVSGGHSAIVDVTSWCEYSLLGQTRDDAVGEAIDKVARVLGLPYPGGPQLEKLAELGQCGQYVFPDKFNSLNVFEFSFSGLKSAALNIINNSKQKNETLIRENFAKDFQLAAFRRLIEQTVVAAKERGADKLVLVGGVAANNMLREQLTRKCIDNGINLYFPAQKFCTDNAAMVAMRAYHDWKNEKFCDLSINARSVWTVGTINGN